MATRKLTVLNEHGLHARAAADMVFTVDSFDSQVVVRWGEKSANARSILELLLLGASSGSVIEVTAAGEDEELAIAAITDLVLEGFGEHCTGGGN